MNKKNTIQISSSTKKKLTGLKTEENGTFNAVIEELFKAIETKDAELKRFTEKEDEETELTTKLKEKVLEFLEIDEIKESILEEVREEIRDIVQDEVQYLDFDCEVTVR